MSYYCLKILWKVIINISNKDKDSKILYSHTNLIHVTYQILVSKSAHLSMSNSILMHNVQFGKFQLHCKTKKQKSLGKMHFLFFQEK